MTITLEGSGELHGYIFLQPKVYGYASHSEPAALFNDRELFFPLELDNGDVLLLSKARVSDISGLPLADEDELVRASSPMALVEVTLAGGVTRLGSMPACSTISTTTVSASSCSTATTASAW